jgi:hypothetical protein
LFGLWDSGLIELRNVAKLMTLRKAFASGGPCSFNNMGGFARMLSVMLFLASRDPERNVAIVDALMVGLCVLAITPLISLHMLDIQKVYPGHLVWGRLANGQ